MSLVRQGNTSTNDLHFHPIFLEFFTRCEQPFITHAEEFILFADMLNILRVACLLLVEELKNSAKTNFMLEDEVLFEKHTD